jgi:septal ring factor EnvC (AmiA/AmiB activator)
MHQGNQTLAVLGVCGVAVTLSLFCGCTSGPSQQLSTCEQDKAQLLAAIREQRDEVNALRTQTASLERRLAESETALAGLDPNRKSRGAGASAAEESLDWRAPQEVAREKRVPEARR